MRRVVLLLALGTVAAAATFATVGALGADARAEDLPAPRPVSSFVDAAVAKWRAGDHEGALAEAEAAVAAHPESALAWNLRGWTHLEAARHDAAEADLDKAMDLDPKLAMAMSNRGVVQRDRKDAEGALAWFNLALKTDPRDRIGLRERGRIRIQRKDLAGARKDLELASSVASDDQAVWTNLGWIEESESDWTGAATCYTKALKLIPGDAWTLAARARVLARLGQIDATIADVRAAAERNPKEYEFNLHVVALAADIAVQTGAETGIPIRAYLAQAEYLRGLRAKAPLPCSIQSREDAGASVTRHSDAAGVARAAATTAGLRRLGLVRPGTENAEAARAEARRNQIAGYYDPATGELVIVGSSPDELGDESVIIHEITHALQDQHIGLGAFRLRSLARATPGVADDDLALATLCVSEGDATLVQTIWQICRQQQTLPGAAGPAVRLGVNVASSADPVQMATMATRQSKSGGAAAADQLSKLDPYAVITEVAPYLIGAAFVEKTRSRGGWDAVAKLYEDPPRTMEQIIHPARPGSARDEPTPIPLLDLAAPAGWTRTDARVLGELNAAVLLRSHGTKWRAAREAATGWDGDLLLTFRSGTGADAVIWATTWDTPDDARDFAAAHATILAAKNPDAGPRTTRVAGAGVAGAGVPGAGGVTVETWPCGPGRGTGRTILRGREFFVVEGFGEDEASALEASLLAASIPHVE